MRHGYHILYLGTALIVAVILGFAPSNVLVTDLHTKPAVAAKSKHPPAAAVCRGVQVYPSQDLASVANSKPPGTTFCVNDGHYYVSQNVSVQSKDEFIGVNSDSTKPEVEGTGAEHIFHTKGSNGAHIANLAISGAVGGDYCEPNCGRGIGGGGENLTVENVRAYNNPNSGIGGAGSNLVVRNSTFDHNGSPSFARDGGPVSSAGIKSVNSMYIFNSRFIDNYWTGVWCDMECGAFAVHDSTIIGNGKAGIHYEISTGPTVLEGSVVRHNGGSPQASSTRNAGILLTGSSGADAYGNKLGGNAKHGVLIVADSRTGGSISKVTIRGNAMKSDTIKGCNVPGVTCASNR
jgi:hypothetical protein